MASEEKHPYRSRFRFGFSGTGTRRTREEASVDDFLDSMSRRVKLSDQIDQENLVPVEEEETIDQISQSRGRSKGFSNRGLLRKIVTISTLIGGVAFLWLFGTLNMLADTQALDRLARSPELTSFFSDPIKLGLVALVSFVPVILLRKRHAEDRGLYR